MIEPGISPLQIWNLTIWANLLSKIVIEQKSAVYGYGTINYNG